jgi:indole-3-glycerol phosphate synthase
MPTFLESVVEKTKNDLRERKETTPAADLEARLGPARSGRPFSEALIAEGISLIAEMKRASPSQGPIRPDASVSEVVRAYEAGGARACSILTEPHWFGGTLADLTEARAACTLPLLRKDFIVDAYQLLEARVAGADACLLIVAAMKPKRLARLIHEAWDLGMDCLVEVHDRDELGVAIASGAEVIGINNRNLHTLEVNLDTTYELLADVPAGSVVVAESGIAGGAQVRDLEAAGVDAILVGEHLMRAGDPAGAIRELVGAIQ